MTKGLSKEQFLHIIKSTGAFTVQKYRGRDRNKRLQAKRYVKEGLIKEEYRFGHFIYTMADK